MTAVQVVVVDLDDTLFPERDYVRSGFAAVDSGNSMSWDGLRVDDVAVYYHHDGAIIRRLK